MNYTKEVSILSKDRNAICYLKESSKGFNFS